MDITITVNFGADSLAAINNLAAALTGAAPKTENPLKSVPKVKAEVEKPQAGELATAPAPQPEAETPASVTVAAIRELVQEKAAAKKTAEVKSLLAEFGAANVSTLDKGKYVEFYTKLKAI